MLPVYNMEKYLRQCLDSIISQTLEHIEIICIDDCSTDNSLKILKEYSNKDDRIKILQMPKNSGSGPARNLGMQNATGEFLAFMDSDDYYYDEQCLEVLYNNAITNNVDLCGGNIRFLFDDSKLHQTGNLEFETCKLINTYDVQNPYEYQRYIFRKNTIINHSIEFPAYRRFQDPVFMLECMVAIDKLFIIDKIIYIYRINHKTVAWDIEKCTDMLCGISDLLTIAQDNNFWKGYKKSVEFFLQVKLFFPLKLLLDKKIAKMINCIATSITIDKLSNSYQKEIKMLLKYPLFYFFQPRLTRLFRRILRVKDYIFRFLKE
ncbi:MAG: glycosyltransferase family 2 protein [Victivallaceae bacterium]|nr:glycosyltransferase family 2 protein [Victivallaceae bacterium]